MFLSIRNAGKRDQPFALEAPISVAANVCGTTVNTLAALRKTGAATCNATSGSSALANVVQRQKMGDDGLILDQTIREAKKPPSVRRWTIRRVAQNHYTGTLTDAIGPVTAEVVGPRAHIKYLMRHGLVVEQEFAQQPDGATLVNRLVVHKFGARVATLNETIKRVAP